MSLPVSPDAYIGSLRCAHIMGPVGHLRKALVSVQERNNVQDAEFLIRQCITARVLDSVSEDEEKAMQTLKSAQRCKKLKRGYDGFFRELCYFLNSRNESSREERSPIRKRAEVGFESVYSLLSSPLTAPTWFTSLPCLTVFTVIAFTIYCKFSWKSETITFKAEAAVPGFLLSRRPRHYAKMFSNFQKDFFPFSARRSMKSFPIFRN